MRDASPLQGSWHVTAYLADDELVAPDERHVARLTIDGSRVSGSLGVNRISGELVGDLPVGPYLATRMTGPPELMKQEDTLLDHIQRADTIHVAREGITFSREGLLLVTLERTNSAEAGPAS